MRGGRIIAKTYITTSGDMWDAIAYKTMGSELYTSALIAANPAEMYRRVFPADVALVIPDKSETAITNMPPWKKVGVIYG